MLSFIEFTRPTLSSMQREVPKKDDSTTSPANKEVDRK